MINLFNMKPTVWSVARSITVGAFLLLALMLIPSRASAIAVPVMVVTDIPHGIKELGLDVAVKVAATAIQEELVGSITDWVVGGFAGGNPSFILNPKDLFSRAQLNAANVFQQQLANSNVCQPYRASINRAVAESATEKDDETYGTQAEVTASTECSVDQLITSGNIDNYFTAGGFANEGGLAPLMQMAFNPADDPLRAPELAATLQRVRQAKAALEAKEEVDRGGGFESLKECAPGQGTLDVNCALTLIQTPGKTIAASLEKSLNQSLDEIGNADEISELLVGIIQGLTQRAMSNAGLR